MRARIPCVHPLLLLPDRALLGPAWVNFSASRAMEPPTPQPTILLLSVWDLKAGRGGDCEVVAVHPSSRQHPTWTGGGTTSVVPGGCAVSNSSAPVVDVTASLPPLMLPGTWPWMEMHLLGYSLG